MAYAHTHTHTHTHTHPYLKIWLRPDNLLPRWHTLVTVGKNPHVFACSWQDALDYIWGKSLHGGRLPLTEWASHGSKQERTAVFPDRTPRLSSPLFILLVRSKSLSAAHTRGRRLGSAPGRAEYRRTCECILKPTHAWSSSTIKIMNIHHVNSDSKPNEMLMCLIVFQLWW